MFTPGESVAQDHWIYLTDLPYERVSTEYLMVGKEDIPSVDTSVYTGDPITLGGQAFSKGVGTYAPSEIVYRVNGAYVQLDALVGVEVDGLPGVAKAQFQVYLDGVLAYESPIMLPGDAAVEVSVPITDINELRLVALPSVDSERSAQVGWVDMRVLASKRQQLATDQRFLRALTTQRAALREQRTAQSRELAAWASQTINTLQVGLGKLPGVSDEPVALADQSKGIAGLVNNRLAVVLGMGRGKAGQNTLSIIDVASQRAVAPNLSPAVQVGGQQWYELNDATTALQWADIRVEDVRDAGLGDGVRMTIPFRVAQGSSVVTLQLSLFKDQSALLYGLTVVAPTHAQGAVRFAFLGMSGQGELNVGQQPQYVTDFVRLRHVIPADDGLLYKAPVAWAAPLYLWDAETNAGLIMASLGDTPQPPEFTFRLNQGQVSAHATFTSQAVRGDEDAGSFASPVLYLEPVSGDTFQEQFSTYRRTINAYYPPPDLPSWFRYQWLSWYVYYMDESEDEFVRQIDSIAEHFGDLGPWHIIVDAGWYIAEGRPGGDWRNQDFDKFPRGMRWLVDYAHSKGIKVVLYFSGPYLNGRPSPGSWLGLSKIVDEHPDWLLPLDDTEPYDNYVYDMQHPGLRSYLSDVMRDYWVRYGVDGIKLDGLGSSGDAVLFSNEGREFGLSQKSLAQTLDLYKFVYDEAKRYKDDPYIESGWITPPSAHAYSHTFRYGDEEPLFTRPYPLPGLMEHIDYAAFQMGFMGQRANMGAIYGDSLDFADVHRWWLGAALALGAQVSISVDMGNLPEESINSFRKYLKHYRPFEGILRIDNALEQQVFSNQVGETWYVGMLNRQGSARPITLDATQLGMRQNTAFVIYDVERDSLFEADGSFTATLDSDSFRLFVVRPQQPGLLWTNSVTETSEDDRALDVRVTAPHTISGTVQFYVPSLTRVVWDGDALERRDAFGDGDLAFTYDDVSSLLTVWYPAGGAHQLRITY